MEPLLTKRASAMDRTKTSGRRWILLLLLGTLLLSGPACSRMKTIRAQDSPLPGLPLIGKKLRGAKARLAWAGQSQPQGDGSVAWSGPPRDGRPAAIAGKPRESKPAPPLADAPLVASNRPNVAAPIASPRDDTPKDAAPADSKLADAPAPDPGLERIRTLVDDGRARLAKLSTYQVAMNRRERVNGTLTPVEDVLLSIRRQPLGVRLEWPAGPHKGREVIYSASTPNALLHINMADSVIPMPRMSLAPDSPMVMKNSRHPITEAGLDTIMANLDAPLKAQEAGTPNGEKFTYDGLVTPPEVGRPCHKITRVTAKGEVWVIALDQATSLPALVQESAANGDLLEKYVIGPIQADPPALADASAFNPDARWGAPKGLFGRLTQGGAAASPAVR